MRCDRSCRNRENHCYCTLHFGLLSSLVTFKGNRMFTQLLRTVAVYTTSFILVACGGGGGGGGGSNSGPMPSTSSFPLRAGYTALVSAGETNNFAISGTCAGTATITDAAATPSIFEGVAGFASTGTATFSLTNCTPASIATSSTTYYDANYIPLGVSTPGEEYAKFETVPPPFPTSIMVGDTAIYGTLILYTDSSKAVTTGTRLLSYVVEADTVDTAIINLISKRYDNAAQLLGTQQTRYRIATNGALTIVSIDIQFSTTSSTHLVLTKS